MKDISLYGHLTVDTLLDGETEKKTLGSIANVWKALVGLDCSLNIGLSPIDIGQALIYIDRKAATRVGKASLNLRKFSPKVFESKVHHLSYLNEMSERSFIASLDGIITADICPGRPVMKEVLSLFILLCSRETSSIWEIELSCIWSLNVSPTLGRVNYFFISALDYIARHFPGSVIDDPVSSIFTKPLSYFVI